MMKILKIAVMLTGIALLCGLSFGVVSAANPPEPTYGTAVVDGNYGEWDLEDDFFADMYRAGNPDPNWPGYAIESKLYLRYDCSTQTLYALVLAVEGVPVLVYCEGEDYAEDAYIKVEDLSMATIVDGNSGNDGTPPDFEWVNEYSEGDCIYAEGWEASAPLAPGDYSELNVHTQVFDDDEPQTSAVANRSIALEIDCEEIPPPVPAVSEWAMVGGIVTLATLAVVLLRRRVASA